MIGQRGSVLRRLGAGAVLLAVIATVLTALAAPSQADHEPGHVAVTPLSGNDLNKCQGALPTAGSENTDKRLVGGTLVPGGTAIFEFTYPFDPTDTSGRQDFVILDCVFVAPPGSTDLEPVLAYELHGVPNAVSPFVFQFTVNIPATVPVGAEFCNVGKTTAAPSSAQASNRKAGPACFVVGGDMRVLKVDEAGAPLTGATFSVACTPSSTLLPVIIEGEPRMAYNGTTGADNVIAIAGPQGTSCVITETAAPAGYVLATPASVTRVIGVDGPDIVFTNPRAVGSLAITKVSDTPGTFAFTVDCPGTAVTNQAVTITVAAAGEPGTTSAAIGGLAVGTVCTVTETTAPGFNPQPAQTVTIALGANTVTFTNVRQTGSLVVAKVSDTPGSFTFSVDCPGTAVVGRQVVLDVAAAGPPGATSAPIAGIPTGTVCTVSELPATGFEPRAPQTVTIALGTNTVTFSNVRQTGTLVVAKTTDGGTGTFTFTVNCDPGTAFDQTIQLTGSETRRITGIPTGTMCTVVEAADARFTTVVTPGNGTVVIGTGDNVVRFVNTAIPPVLAVAKTADAGSVVAGGAVGYTVTVTNTGKGVALGATLEDPLPALPGVNWAVSPAYAGPGTCSVTGAAPAQLLGCSFGDLAPGATATVHVSSATAAASAGTLVNTATARAANFGPVTATATIVVTVPTAVLGQVVTQAQVATTVAPTTTTSTTAAPVTTTTTAAPVVASQTLPRTGANVRTLLVVGLGLVAMGVAFDRIGRRRNEG